MAYSSKVEEKMYQSVAKKVKVFYKDGDIREGFCNTVINAIDNDPEVAAIVINQWLYITEPEIKNIEILE